jgi:molybdopterin-containing oxidoreductase family membrane subunit
VSTGIGTWGLNKTVGWAWDITNFVWWVVLVTTLILLYYYYSVNENGINRSAEAMTIFSVIQAGLFPIIHMGRPWLAYWCYQFRINLVLWVNLTITLGCICNSNVFISFTSFLVDCLLPDFAMLRDRAITPLIKEFTYS